jgi:hypothetical protein
MGREAENAVLVVMEVIRAWAGSCVVVDEIHEAKEVLVDEETVDEGGSVGSPKSVDAVDEGTGDRRSIHDRR